MAPRLNEAPTTPLSADTYLTHYRLIRRQSSEGESVRGTLGALKKAAKKDGVNLDALALVEKLAKMEEEAATMFLRDVFRYAGWSDIHIGRQKELFALFDSGGPSEKAKAELSEHVAFETGVAAGEAGRKQDDCQFEPGTAVHVAWVRGWNEGQARIAKRMEMTGEDPADQPKPASERRGRRKARTDETAPVY